MEPRSVEELANWVRNQYGTGDVTLTYIVTRDGHLRVSDRHTEHVACARGEAVLAAGELELQVDKSAIAILGITNQSTGYCPEPSCFSAVAQALVLIDLRASAGFTHEFIFRRCPTCHGITIVKEDDFECACGESLPRSWNFG
jgi:hypothetical protein